MFVVVNDGKRGSAARLNAARANLADKVRAWRQRTGAAGAFRFGDLAAGPARADQTCQLNFQRIESALFGDVDDFYAAIGRAKLRRTPDRITPDKVISEEPGDARPTFVATEPT